MHLFNIPLPSKSGELHQWGNLSGSSLGLAISHAARLQPGLTVVVVPDSLTAHRLENEIRFFNRGNNSALLIFPDWETLPYDTFSPHQDIISQRIFTLYQLSTASKGILIVPIITLMQRVSPKNYLTANSFALNKGDQFSIDTMRKRFEECGYRRVDQVMEHGEYSVRGSLFDLYPMGSEHPFRIDLFDQEVETIRVFDPETQRSIETIDSIQLLPAKEYPLTEDAITHFRQQWRDKFTGNPTNCPIYQDISEGISSPGVEYYLPLFFDHTETLFDYFPKGSLVLRVGDLTHASEKFWQEIQERFEQRRYDQTKPLLPPQEVFLPTNDMFAGFNLFTQIKLSDEKINEGAGKFNFPILPSPTLLINHKAEKPLAELENFLIEAKNRILFCAESAGRREALLDLLKSIQIFPTVFSTWQDFLAGDAHLGVTVAPLEQGLSLLEPAITLIAESQLFGQQVMQRRRRLVKQQDSDAIVKNLAELHVGAAVVHIDHGVGRYLGLQTITVDDRAAEYLTLEYASADKLYVPVASLHLISRYSGVDLENAPLNRLGTDQWNKTKRKATEQVCDVAAELLDIYARRSAREGFTFNAPDVQYNNFAAAFPFETTPDQQIAIDQVIEDMASGKAMDRLVCGDVGFGKTEVAMRAAFIAVQSEKQVALLVPTTLLANQHYQNFKDRFADWPINIEMISRFRSAQEQTEILKKLEAGRIDIIIGTHKLLQSGIKFNALGLVIIDEEHRFGVKQKEQLKSLRSEVDILTLTATPIPRTLNMAMSAIRDLSIIATPPAKRLSIKTFVRQFDTTLVREAILREISRGGQVYFLHNAVDSIYKTADEIAALLPETRVGVAHGQMREKELEQAMADFYHHRFNVLVCTTIIESGIDVPTANTIIINRADKFGLAQLHQLRGRVGRSHHQAYAYLLTPPKNVMTADAEKRLEAIMSLEDLGAGFTLATHDLEIRGAGELLGEEQSGSMQAVGYALYMELLENAVAALKEGKEPSLEKPLHHGAEIDLQFSALIPDDYVPDVHSRLILYKRIANAKDLDTLIELQVEMVDRFGILPIQAKNLFLITELKLKANPLGIRKIEAGATSGRIEFEEHPNIDPIKIISLMQKQPEKFKLEGQQRLRFNFPFPQEKPVQRVETIAAILGQLH